VHLTAASAVRKGWAKRGKQMVRSANSGEVQGGPRLYRITPAGRAAIS